MVRDSITRKSKGFGFVQFTTSEAAIALKALKHINVQGKTVCARCHAMMTPGAQHALCTSAHPQFGHR